MRIASPRCNDKRGQTGEERPCEGGSGESYTLESRVIRRDASQRGALFRSSSVNAAGQRRAF
jgi:hypothetical protein